MNCPHCNRENREGLNFCTGCGKRLPGPPAKWYLKRRFVLTLLLISCLCVLPVPIAVIFLLCSPELSRKAKIALSFISLGLMLTILSLGAYTVYKRITKSIDAESATCRVFVIQRQTGEIKKIIEEKSLMGFEKISWQPHGSNLFIEENPGFSQKQRIIDTLTGKERSLAARRFAHSFQWSPEGSRISYCTQDERGEFNILIDNIKENTTRKIPPGAQRLVPTFPSFTIRSMPEWSPEGDMLAYDITRFSNNKLAVFDLSKDREIIIDEIPHTDLFSWSPAGRSLAYIKSDREGSKLCLWTSQAAGNDKRELAAKNGIQNLKWSPDGKRILYSTVEGKKKDILLLNLDDSSSRLLCTRVDSTSPEPLWSFDGSWIATTSSDTQRKQDAPVSWTIMKSDGKDSIPIKVKVDPIFSPVEDKVAYIISQPDKSDTLYLLDLKSGLEQKLVEKNQYLFWPKFSPDGGCIAYIAWNPEVKKYSLCLLELDGSGEKEAPLTGSPEDMHWSYDSTMLATLSITRQKGKR